MEALYDYLAIVLSENFVITMWENEQKEKDAVRRYAMELVHGFSS